MNGIYLYLLMKEIRDKLIGLHIDEICSKHRLIQIICGNKGLFISLYPEAPAVFLAKKVKQDFKKLKPFSEHARSSRIIAVEQRAFTPVLQIQLEKSTGGRKRNAEIVVSLYRQAPNFGLKSAYKQRNLFARFIEKKPKQSIIEFTEKHLESLRCQNHATFHKILTQKVEGIDRYLASELTHKNLRELKKIVHGKEMKPRLISISPLKISFFESNYIEEYSSLNRLLQCSIVAFVEKRLKKRQAQLKKELVTRLTKRITRLRKKLLTQEEIESHRVSGELILTNISLIKKGAKQVALFNPYADAVIHIKLDPQKTPQANAQYYFTKYKKLKRGQPKIEEKIERLRKEIEQIEEDFFKTPEVALVERIAKKEKVLPFRLFNLTSGAKVYVGKNARSNQELTFQVAKPNDYFFHVRNYEGSHAILKAYTPKGQKPKKQDIETAASIAAYFSKAKNQKNVPVSYTQRKYLKKNKKGIPGSVMLIREEVIFVDPRLPEEKPNTKH